MPERSIEVEDDWFLDVQNSVKAGLLLGFRNRLVYRIETSELSLRNKSRNNRSYHQKLCNFFYVKKTPGFEGGIPACDECCIVFSLLHLRNGYNFYVDAVFFELACHPVGYIAVGDNHVDIGDICDFAEASAAEF